MDVVKMFFEVMDHVLSIIWDLLLLNWLMYGGKWIIGEKYLELTIPPMLKKSKRAYKGD